MKHQKSLIFALPILIVCMMAPGCRSGGQRAPGTIDDQEASEIADRIETIKQVYHLCPSPAEMLSVIDMEGMNYQGELLNPAGNVERYNDTRSRTLNLGVYIADLAYAALFGRHEATLDYLDVVSQAAEQVRVTGAVNETLITKAHDNVDHLDSLFDISNEAFINMLFFCERNNRPNTIVLLSAGALIESLYLAVNMVDDHEDSGYLLRHLADQKYAIDNLTVFAESLKEEDPNIARLLEDMSAIRSFYDDLDTGDGEMTVTPQADDGTGQPKKLVIGASSEPEGLDREAFARLKEEVIRLRTKMVEGQ